MLSPTEAAGDLTGRPDLCGAIEQGGQEQGVPRAPREQPSLIDIEVVAGRFQTETAEGDHGPTCVVLDVWPVTDRIPNGALRTSGGFGQPRDRDGLTGSEFG